MTTIFMLGFSKVEDHNIHLSKCEINETDKNGKIELSVSIFYDDLLSAVGLTVGEELPADYNSSDDLIQAFINENLILEINGITKVLKYVDSYSYPPAVWTTFEVDQKEEIKEFKIKNTILLNQFDDQKNIVSFPWKGKTKTVAMDHKNHFISLRR
jgi:hypothetical protein